MKRLSLIAAALVCSLVSCFAFAAGPGADATPVELPQPFAVGSNFIGITLNLLLVLAAIVVLAWVFKRAQGVGRPAAGRLKVAATLPLGPRDRILLLEVGDEQILVGASSAGLRTLHVLEQPLDDSAVTPAADDESFRARLSRAMGGQTS